MSPEFTIGFAQVNDVPAVTQNSSALHAGGAPAHHQYTARGGGFGEVFRMPPAAIFFADGDILGAHDLAALLKLRHANIAADTLADILHSPFRDLRRQKGIRNRRARAADDIEHTGANELSHFIWACEAPIADDRNTRPQDRL